MISRVTDKGSLARSGARGVRFTLEPSSTSLPWERGTPHLSRTLGRAPLATPGRGAGGEGRSHAPTDRVHGLTARRDRPSPHPSPRWGEGAGYAWSLPGRRLRWAFDQRKK